ncbi:MAG: AMP-dependent synthetase [Rhodospirillaceae bacterium]|nr:AMP-dependent synthetase [Rhodospirillaceae bacterium]
MNLSGMLSRTALTYPNKSAVSVGCSKLLTYAQLANRVTALGSELKHSLKLNHGDRVALIMKNSAETIEIIFACWHAGLCVVPINAKLHPREFGFILADSGAKACFFTKDLSGAVTDAKIESSNLTHLIEVGASAYESLLEGSTNPMSEVSPTDLAWLFYTSGTTGRPKGAMLTHRNMHSMTMNYLADVDSIEPGDSIIHAAPMSHGSGLYVLPHIARAANNVIPSSGGFDVAETLELINYWPACTFFFAPTMVTRLINAPNIDQANTKNLKTIVYGGAPMYLNDTLKALEILGPKLVQIYGQGESPMTITVLPKRIINDFQHPKHHQRLASVGISRTDVEVRVVDENGSSVEPEEVGEIVVRGDVVMAGYWNNPEATKDAIRDGWLWTGDVGTLDVNGFLTLKDRSKDMIISGGTNIYPREIEEILLKHPSVYECAVVGRFHEDWGETATAFVAPYPSKQISAEELDRLCLENIARFKKPKDYRFVDSLPKNNYGKILKTELRLALEQEET